MKLNALRLPRTLAALLCLAFWTPVLPAPALAEPASSRFHQVTPSAAYAKAYEAGDYRAAVPLARAELNACRAAHTAPFPACFTLWSELLDSALYTRDDDLVEREGKAFLASAEMADGSDSIAVSTAVGSLASLYMAQGRLREAEPLKARDTAITLKQQGPNATDFAIALGNQGVLLDAMGRYGEAEGLYRRAIDIADKAAREAKDEDVRAEGTRLYTIQRNNLGRNLDNQGRLEESATESETALRLYDQVYPLGHPARAVIRNNRAITLRQLGRLDEAETLAREAYAIQLARFGPNDRETLTAQLTLARLLATLRRDGPAEELLRDNIAARRTLGQKPDLPFSLLIYADFLLDRARANEASPLVEEAIAVESDGEAKRPNVIGRARQLLARTLSAGGQLDAAQREARAALALQTGIGNRALTVDAQEVLAEVLAKRGDRTGAVALYREALAEAESSLPPGQSQRLDLRIALAGELAKDAATLPEALAMLETGAAEARAREMIDSFASTDGSHRVSRLAQFGTARIDVIAALLATGAMAHEEAAERSFQAAQEAQRSSTVRAGEIARAGRHSGDPVVATLEQARFITARRIVSDETRLGRLLREEPAGEKAALLSRALADTRAEFENLTARLLAHQPGYLAGLVPRTLDAATASARLKPQEAVLLAVPGANGYGVWLVTAKGLEWRPPQDAPLAAIAHQLAAMQPDRALALRGQVGAQAPSTSSTATRFDESEAERLGNWLLAGFGPRLSNVRQLATVVSGPLAQLPFATLRWNGRWLVDRMMLVRLPAVASLPETIAAPLIAAERGVIALGAVSGTDLPELPGARRQLEDIGALFGGDATIRQGVEATRGWLQGDRRLTQAGVLVFATHSRRSAEPARELALQLAPDPALPGDDGLLSLAQIGELRLTAPLVILTACDTATATPADADPLASFSRAFFLAGAQALLVSHWALDDAAAREQMRRFFEVVRAKPGIAPAEAFRRSALALRDDRSGRWRHPRYWAALSYVEGGTMGSAATVPGASGGKRTVTASPPPARSAN